MDEVLITERLLLPVLSPEDARAVLDGDRNGQPWSAGYPTDGDIVVARILLADPPPNDRVRHFGPRQIVDRASRFVIGGIGFFGPPIGGALGIGYGLAVDARGQGRATEALRRMLTAAGDEPDVHEVRADTAHDNLASQAVMRKAGMTVCGSDDGLIYFSWTPPVGS